MRAPPSGARWSGVEKPAARRRDARSTQDGSKLRGAEPHARAGAATNARPSRPRSSRTAIAAADPRPTTMHPKTAPASTSTAPTHRPVSPARRPTCSPPPARRRRAPTADCPRRRRAPLRRRQGHSHHPRQTHTPNPIPTGSCLQSNSVQPAPFPLAPRAPLTTNTLIMRVRGQRGSGGLIAVGAGLRRGLRIRTFVRSRRVLQHGRTAARWPDAGDYSSVGGGGGGGGGGGSCGLFR